MFTIPQKIGGYDCFSHISCHSNFFGWGVLHIVDFSTVPVSQEIILYLIDVVNPIIVTSKSPFLCAVNHPQMTSVYIYIYLVGFPHLFIFNKTTIFYTCWKISKCFDVENRPSVLGIFIYVPWGGVEWGNNVHVLAHSHDVTPRHVHLHVPIYVMLRWRCVTSRRGGVGWGNNVHVLASVPDQLTYVDPSGFPLLTAMTLQAVRMRMVVCIALGLWDLRWCKVQAGATAGF